MGRMGARMANRLLAAGHTVTVYNRTSEKAISASCREHEHGNDVFDREPDPLAMLWPRSSR